MKAFNINHYVFVELTPEGEDVLRRHYAEMDDRTRSNVSESALKSSLDTRPGKEGHRKFQLYELMNIFGPFLYTGSRPMFVNNEIHFS